MSFLQMIFQWWVFHLIKVFSWQNISEMWCMIHGYGARWPRQPKEETWGGRGANGIFMTRDTWQKLLYLHEIFIFNVRSTNFGYSPGLRLLTCWSVLQVKRWMTVEVPHIQGFNQRSNQDNESGIHLKLPGLGLGYLFFQWICIDSPCDVSS